MNRLLALLFFVTTIALSLHASAQSATPNSSSTANPNPVPQPQPIPNAPKSSGATGPMILTNAPASGPPNIMAPAPTPVSKTNPAGTPGQ